MPLELAENLERTLSNVHASSALDEANDDVISNIPSIRDGFFRYMGDDGQMNEHAANDARLDEVIGATGSCDGAKLV